MHQIRSFFNADQEAGPKKQSRSIVAPSSESPVLRLRDCLPFTVMFGAIFIWKLASFPPLGLRAEMYVEGGSDYYYLAAQRGLWQNLATPDNGLVWLARLTSVAIDRLGIPFEWIATTYQLLALGFIAASCACFALPAFRRLVASDAIRGVVCVGLAQFDDFWAHTYPVASHFGTILVLEVLFLSPWLLSESMSWGGAVALGLMLALLAGSKGSMLIFAPALLTLIIAASRRRNWQAFAAFSLPFLVLLLQGWVVTTYRIFKLEVPWRATLEATIAHSVTFVSEAPAGRLAPMIGRWPVLAAAIVAWTTLVATVWVGRKPERTKYAWLIWIALATAGSCALLGAYGAWYYGYGALRWMDAGSAGAIANHTIIRHFIGGSAVAFLLFVVLATTVIQRRSIQLSCAVVLIVTTGVFHVRGRLPPPTTWPVVGYSNWSAFGPVVRESPDSYCVPLNDYPWLVRHKCDYLVEPPSADSVQKSDYRADREFAAPDTVRAGTLQLAGLVLSDSMRTDRTLSLDALDATGMVVGSATRIEPDRGIFTFFWFRPSISGIARVRLRRSNEEGLVELKETCLPECRPVGVWMGRAETQHYFVPCPNCEHLQ
jgi:hypothetical protein